MIDENTPPFFAWTTNPLHQEYGGVVSVVFFPGGPEEVRKNTLARINLFLSHFKTFNEAKVATLSLDRIWKEEFISWRSSLDGEDLSVL
jgi:hypothetical protein